jgi:lipopolysaccharide/colanic/teichoic acid biosynthesis glycosyltransferase
VQGAPVTPLPTTWRLERAGAAKRVLDVAAAGVALVLLAPVAAVAALSIKLTTRGPVLFRQLRVGRDGVPFELVKFRTMLVGTHASVLADPEERRAYEENGFKLPPDDPRITTVGRWLRRLSVDEIPQLVNVLRGEMSMVGIRPVEREQLEQRGAADQAIYLVARPGLTGLWQIDGRSDLGPDDRIDLDRRYARDWSIRSDLRILLMTPVAVLRRSGAH